MNGDERKPQSFSVARRFGAGLNLLVTLAAVFSIVGMLNYLSMRHFTRLKWTRNTDTELSKRTLHVLRSLTNTVRVVTYFDSSDDLFPRVRALLKEYETASGGKVRVQHVDYLRDYTLANKIKLEFKLQTGNKDLVLFESGGRTEVVSASALSDYDYSNLYSGKSREVYRTHFKGELLFTSKIFGVAMQRSPKAYFLIGHGESDPRDTTAEGYSKFAMVLQGENNFELALLDLTSQKDVPADCNLLIISGPLTVIDEQQAERIQRYLEKGGRLLLLFNYRQLATRRPSGLEKLLAAWGVEAGENIVVDPDNSTTSTGTDPKPAVPGKHPIVSSLGSAQTHLFMPRTMHALKTSTPRREEAKVEELLFTGPRTQLITKLGERGAYEPQRGVGPQPLCVAVEKSIPAIDRGSTRIVALGDSTLWANNVIESDANREFAASTVNWLVQQNILLAEIPRQAIRTYRLSMTRAQLRNSRWLLLAAMPGAVLLAGCLVWVRRRS